MSVLAVPKSIERLLGLFKKIKT
jgi:hypothetical protein